MEYTKLAGYKVVSLEKIPSTQTYALDMLARGGGQHKTVIVAQAQSDGRGRYRRKWVSHHGNLYASFIFHEPNRNPCLSYRVAVAVAETIQSFSVNAKIKWPNDIMVDGKKIAGILIEYAGPFVVVGIGINIKSNPTVDAAYKTTKMDVYKSVSSNDVLTRLTNALDKWMVTDFAMVRQCWMDMATGLNRVVQYRGDLVELIGINDMGALVLRRGAEYLLAYGDEIIMS